MAHIKASYVSELADAYTRVVGSTPDSAAWDVIWAIVEETDADASAVGCWIRILQDSLAIHAPAIAPRFERRVQDEEQH